MPCALSERRAQTRDTCYPLIDRLGFEPSLSGYKPDVPKPRTLAVREAREPIVEGVFTNEEVTLNATSG